MFTGIIKEIGTVKSIVRGSVYKLVIEAAEVSGGVQIGDSVAVNGVCLTVTAINNSDLSFDAVSETISRSSLSELKYGGKVNLEPALRVGDMLGGHIVQGHIDGIGTVKKISSAAYDAVIEISAPSSIMHQIVEKGSVALDGVSLTVAKCSESGFSVAVIPHTLQNTVLHERKAGDKINIETDILGKYVEKLLHGKKTDVTMDFLTEAGFL